MEIYYYKAKRGNFGDDLNMWLWPKLVPELYESDPDVLFVGIGTLLNKSIPAGRRKIVFGSGTGYGDLPQVDDTYKFYCVRGPLTQRAMNLEEGVAITDPAILVQYVLSEANAANKLREGVAFMPHHASMRYVDWESVCASAEIRFISPEAPVEGTLQAIGGSELLLAEAMHGAIVADALRVPWIPVRFGRHINDFKWRDWTSSLGLSYKPHIVGKLDWLDSVIIPKFIGRHRRALIAASKLSALRLPTELRTLASNAAPVLSSEHVSRDLSDRLLERIDTLKRDLQSGLQWG